MPSPWILLRKAAANDPWARVPRNIREVLRNPDLAASTVEKQHIRKEERRVTGWATVVAFADGRPIVDVHGDVITLDELESVEAELQKDTPVMGHQHTLFEGIGYFDEVFCVTRETRKWLPLAPSVPYGVLVSGVVTSPLTWALVKAGEMLAFSFGGTATREPLLLKSAFTELRRRLRRAA